MINRVFVTHSAITIIPITTSWFATSTAAVLMITMKTLSPFVSARSQSTPTVTISQCVNRGIEMKIDGNGNRDLNNYEYLVGVFNAKGQLVKVYTGRHQQDAARFVSEREGYFVKEIFASMGDQF